MICTNRAGVLEKLAVYEKIIKIDNRREKKSEKEDPIHEDNKMAKARPGSVRSMLSGDDISIARAFHGQ